MLRRKQGIKRSQKPLKRSALAQVSNKKKPLDAQYKRERDIHLGLHPLCQLTMAYLRINEKKVLADFRNGFVVPAFEGSYNWRGTAIPLATEIHHRNKRDGRRLVDRRWFASASREMHDWVEDHKQEARAEGFLLPFEADIDGRLPNGEQCLTTDEWLAERSSK